jgi:hypothetical protein
VAKYPGRGIVFRRNTSGSTYADVGQVLEVDKFGSTRGTIDATAYGDTWADFVLGVQEGDDVALRLAFDPANAQHTALYADYQAATPKNYQIQNTLLSPSRTLTAPALVTEYHEGGAIDGVYEAEMVMKIVQPGVSIS